MAALSAYVHGAIRTLAADPKAAATAVTGSVGAYAGLTAMSYNKENFTVDQEQRFGRFTMARANMIAQVGQYRFDIRGLANITVTKAHVFLDTAQLFMCVSAACTCAGRVGMHGSAPPGWLAALYTGNIFLGAMYLTICMWLGFHCTLRAQCGMVSLLTRKVRLPIPSLAMINQARNFGSAYEKQQWWDILRFPWVSHPFDNPEIPGASSDEEGSGSDDGKGNKKVKSGKKDRKKGQEGRSGDYAASEAFGSTGRASVPSWIRDEQVIDKGRAAVPRHVPAPGGMDLPLHDSNDPHDAPDHFKLFTEAQKEWFPYETYHKIAMLFGVMCFFHAVCYYCIITAMSELRGFWIGWAIPGLFMTGQYWLMQLDIFEAKGTQYLRNFELFGHVAPFLASAGATCEFRFQYSSAQVGVGWAFAIACLASHMLFACRFFDLMTPDTFHKEMPEEDGKSWWPRSWSYPLAFAGTAWQLTGPSKLKAGQHDLLHEALNLEKQNGGICKLRNRKGGSKQKPSKRGSPQNPHELMNHVNDLDIRFRHVWEHVVGKDQVKLNHLHGLWTAANKEATEISDHFKTIAHESGSGSSSDEGFADYVNGKGRRTSYSDWGDQLRDLSEQLNHIEDSLAEIENTHQTNGKASSTVASSSGGEVTGTSTRGLPQTPYWIMRAAVCTHIFVFFMLIVFTSVEILLGTESLFAPPGEPPWIRNQKLRVYKPTGGTDGGPNYLHLSNAPLPEWYRLFVASEIPEPVAHGAAHGAASSHSPAPAAHSPAPAAHAAGHSPAPAAGHAAAGHAPAPDAHHRRLELGGENGAFNDLFSALPALDWLATEYLNDDAQKGKPAGLQPSGGSANIPSSMPEKSKFGSDAASEGKSGFMAHTLQALPAEWPPLFEPRHLACQSRASGTAMVALTPRGFGALLHVKNESRSMKPLAAEQFALAGITTFGPLVGASWGTSGLHLVTKAGHLLHCPGHAPSDGAWLCQADGGAPVPISSGMTLTAGAVNANAQGRTLALLFEDMPSTVVLYEEDIGSQRWRAGGEVHVPPGFRHTKLGFAGESLMMMAEDGAVHQRPLREGGVPSLLPAPTSSITREWHAACATSAKENDVVRLALRQASAHMAAAWRPELVVTAMTNAPPTPLVNV